MAEFPHPEYRNLWRYSALSKDRSGIVSNIWSDGGVQIADGLELTIVSTPNDTSQSLTYTGNGRVEIEGGKTYSVAIPVRNSGALPFPLKFAVYIGKASGGDSSSRSVMDVIAPGESKTVKIENIQTLSTDATLRFSTRYDAGEPRPPLGGKLVLLDGISFTEGETAPPFPFNGDGILPVGEIEPPTGRTTVWDSEPYKSTSTLWVGPATQVSGVFEVGASTAARLGIVSDIYSRSREKIQLKLAGVDDLVRSGHRIELAAAAMTSTPAVWHWRQVTGPTVALNVRENTCDFIAPDVERSTRIRIGVYAASEDGGNRSDWHYFDLDVEPPMLRFRGGDDGDFSPRSPYLVGYSRGKREIWNDVIRPATYEKNPRHELEVVDLGVPDDDVVFSTETPRRMAAGGVWVNPETGDVFRNFGAGYNETDDTTASPRTSTYWVNPANGDILEWIED